MIQEVSTRAQPSQAHLLTLYGHKASLLASPSLGFPLVIPEFQLGPFLGVSPTHLWSAHQTSQNVVSLEITNLVLTPGTVPQPCTWGLGSLPFDPIVLLLASSQEVRTSARSSSNPVAFSPSAPCPGRHENSCRRVTPLVSADSSQAFPHLPGRSPSLSPTCPRQGLCPVHGLGPGMQKVFTMS